MVAKSDMSYEFASLIRELRNSPDDIALRQTVVKQLPEMKVLANDNALALFRLAQIYSPTSTQYKQMMRESANKGCTNAMLALCELLLKTNSAADLKTAAHYMTKIEYSNDSFMIKSGELLLENNPQLASEIESQSKKIETRYMGRFFHQPLEKNQTEGSDLESSFSVS